MAEYIDRETVIDLITKRYENPEICTQEINRIPALDVAPVVHGVPISKNRPQKYEMYEETGTGENGETSITGYRLLDDEGNALSGTLFARKDSFSQKVLCRRLDWEAMSEW